MTTWRDVERVHRAHPKWTAREIATELGCSSPYVRATAQRRRLDIPRSRRCKAYARVLIPFGELLPFCKPKESPTKALKRIVKEAMNARAA